MKKFNEQLNHLVSNKEVVFEFLREKYPLFYNSNIFLRDLQYGIRTYFERKDIMIKYPEAEELAFKFAAKMESEDILTRLDTSTWLVKFKFSEPVLETADAAANSDNEKGTENE
jgi:hypothetical protein